MLRKSKFSDFNFYITYTVDRNIGVVKKSSRKNTARFFYGKATVTFLYRFEIKNTWYKTLDVSEEDNLAIFRFYFIGYG